VQGAELAFEREARALLNQGQPFLALDAVTQGLEQFPQNVPLRQIGALSLVQSGAVDEARRMLQAMPGWASVDDRPFRELHDALKAAVDSLKGAPRARKGETDKRALDAVARLSEALESARGKRLVSLVGDASLLGVMARVYHEIWRRTDDEADLRQCRGLYLDCFNGTGDVYAGVAAAITSRLVGEAEEATRLARSAVAHAARQKERQEAAEEALGEEDAAVLQASLGAAWLLLGNDKAARGAYERALRLAGGRYHICLAARRELLRLQQAGVEVPEDLPELLRPPSIVVFTGPPLDRPGRETPLFPPHLEPHLRREIEARLDLLNAQIGYCSGSAGADILFVEAMLERGAEVNIVLPFELEDFVRCNVAYAGRRWERRFRNALKLASTVSFATNERFLGHEMLFRFGNQVLHGLSTLRGDFLGSPPYLLAVWDLMPGSLPGGAADFIDQWGDAARVNIVDIDELNMEHPAPESEAPATDVDPAALLPVPAASGPQRIIKAMLFADLVGFSKLGEEHVPAFLTFVQRLHKEVSGGEHPPEFVKTWGDGIFAVAGRAVDMADFALRLRDAVTKVSTSVKGLPSALRIRISLHAGPVFEMEDPFTGLGNCYGTHINRAARLEPVTVPGHVYATQPLVALLTAEQSEARNEAERLGEPYRERFHCDYVGILPLAKGFGREAVYHLRGAD